MFSKLIITVFVITVAFFVLRQRQVNSTGVKAKQIPGQPGETSSNNSSTEEKAPRDELSQDLRIGAYLFLVLTVAIGGALYYFQWQDDHTVLTVNLFRDNQIEPVTYQVFKYQLDDKSFITVDGLSVAVASSERMEVIGLD